MLIQNFVLGFLYKGRASLMLKLHNKNIKKTKTLKLVSYTQQLHNFLQRDLYFSYIMSNDIMTQYFNTILTQGQFCN
jgi:hypothetical protein